MKFFLIASVISNALWANATSTVEDTMIFNQCVQEQIAMIAYENGLAIVRSEKEMDKDKENRLWAQRQYILECYNLWWDQEIKMQMKFTEEVPTEVCEEKITVFQNSVYKSNAMNRCLHRILKMNF